MTCERAEELESAYTAYELRWYVIGMLWRIRGMKQRIPSTVHRKPTRFMLSYPGTDTLLCVLLSLNRVDTICSVEAN